MDGIISTMTANEAQIEGTGDEVDDYNKLIALSGEDTAQAVIKRILHEHLK